MKEFDLVEIAKYDAFLYNPEVDAGEEFERILDEEAMINGLSRSGEEQSTQGGEDDVTG